VLDRQREVLDRLTEVLEDRLMEVLEGEEVLEGHHRPWLVVLVLPVLRTLCLVEEVGLDRNTIAITITETPQSQ
jgi:hypothetical protein